MARSPVTFQAAFDAFCRRLNFTPAQIAANSTLQAGALQDFNETYQLGLDVPSPNQWEDARQGAAVTPDAGFIEWSVIGDAHSFSLWTADPRFKTDAVQLFAPRDWTSDLSGIQLRDTSLATVWASWQPTALEFTTTAWVGDTPTNYAIGDRVLYTNGHNYRCLVAHPSSAGSFPTDLAAGRWVLMPVLAVLKQFLIDHAQGTYDRRNGQPKLGFDEQEAAIRKLEKISFDELQQQSQQYDRNVVVAYPAAGSSAATARYLEWPSGLTGLTGGGSTNLDGLTTTAYTTGKLVCFAISAQFQVWELQAVSTAEDAANGIVRPDDYDATTNQRTWIRIA